MVGTVVGGGRGVDRHVVGNVAEDDLQPRQVVAQGDRDRAHLAVRRDVEAPAAERQRAPRRVGQLRRRRAPARGVAVGDHQVRRRALRRARRARGRGCAAANRSSIVSTNGGTKSSAITCAWGCSIDAPAALPWLTNACACGARRRGGLPMRSRRTSNTSAAASRRRDRRTSDRARATARRLRARRRRRRRRVGYLFGTTRTRQPGVSGSPGPRRATSGGVSCSLPSQNGQAGTEGGSSGASVRNVSGRTDRPGATITRAPVSRSSRSSDIDRSRQAYPVRPKAWPLPLP